MAKVALTRGLGLPDEAFEQRRPLRGQITKREVRAVSLYSLGLRHDSVVWDIGAGTGSISVEASLIAWQGTVYAIERDQASLPLLQANVDKWGSDNVRVVPGEAPKALEAYQVLGTLFKDTSLTTTEQHVVWLTINYENDCGYCVPAHTALAKLDTVPDDVIEALRDGTPIADARLEALRTFTAQVVQERGWVPHDNAQAFLDAGFTQQQILEVILGLAHKVISNYTNHFARTPVDAAFKKFTWKKPALAGSAK